VRFDWDAANTGHLWERHQLLPATVEEAMRYHRRQYRAVVVNHERRTLYLAETRAGDVLAVVTTQRRRKTRVVSARPASRQERKIFRGVP
jgi:uncharacterized DUF497 family protein